MTPLKQSEPIHSPACPIPIRQYPRVLLAHGGGGKLMHELLEKMFFSAFGEAPAEGRHDCRGAAISRRAAGLHHRFLRRPARLFFRAATSVRWRSTARSTTWR